MMNEKDPRPVLTDNSLNTYMNKGEKMSMPNNILSPSQSLALYINHALLHGMTMEDCQMATDYHEAFQPYESHIRENILEITGQEVMALDNIALSQDSYRQVLAQLQRGITPWRVELPFPPVISPEKGMTLDGYYRRIWK